MLWEDSPLTLHQHRHLQHPRPIRAGLLQDSTNFLDTDRRLVLDSTGNDSIVDNGDLSTDEDEVTEAGSARQDLADGSETGDVLVSLRECAGAGGECGGAGESGEGCKETKVEEHGGELGWMWEKDVRWVELCRYEMGGAVVTLAFIPRTRRVRTETCRCRVGQFMVLLLRGPWTAVTNLPVNQVGKAVGNQST